MKKVNVLSLLGAAAILVVGCQTDTLPTEVEAVAYAPATESAALGVKEINGIIRKAIVRLAPSDIEWRVKGQIDIIDNGRQITFNGMATGLNPAAEYFSNAYDIRSVAGGPGACMPTIDDPDDPDYLMDKMRIGMWDVDENGKGELTEQDLIDAINNLPEYVPVEKIGTISIRRVTSDPWGVLVACGKVAVQGAR